MKRDREMIDREDELLKKAKLQEERNEKIYKRRAETVDKISKMSNSEYLDYCKEVEKSNDEFLNSLGIKREDISSSVSSKEKDDELQVLLEKILTKGEK